MNAGRLRQRVTLQRQADGAADAYGSPTREWIDVATVWARVEETAGRELERAKQIHAETTVVVTTRYRAACDSAVRLRYGARLLNVLGVVADERRRQLTWTCNEAT